MAKITDTETDTLGSVRGIRFVGDPTRAKSPWMLTVFSNGKKKRSFWPSQSAAIKEKKRMERIAERHGKAAHAYDRAAHTEYSQAKIIVGNVSLVDVAKFYAQRMGATKAEETPKINDAVEVLIDNKTSARRSEAHLHDLRSRLRGFKDKFGDRFLSGVSRNEILDWLLALGKQPRTVKNFLSAVQNLYAFGERRGWIENNPCRNIDPKTDLPTISKAPVGVLTVAQGHALLRRVERERPQFLHFFLVQYFAGVRNGEAERFRGEWIDAKQKRLVLPGWFIDGRNKPMPGTKTRDDWVIDGIAEEFWRWIAAYPAPKIFKFPRFKAWVKLKEDFAKAGGDKKIEAWPKNALRHSFATYDLSAYRDQSRTSLMLRHQSAQKLWSNYLAKLVPSEEGKRYFEIRPAGSSKKQA